MTSNFGGVGCEDAYSRKTEHARTATTLRQKDQGNGGKRHAFWLTCRARGGCGKTTVTLGLLKAACKTRAARAATADLKS